MGICWGSKYLLDFKDNHTIDGSETRQTHHLRYLKHLKTLYTDVIITFIHHIQQHHLNWLAGFPRISDHIPRPFRCADPKFNSVNRGASSDSRDSYQGLATMNVSLNKH